MNPSEIVEGIQDYIGVDYGVKLDDIIIAQYTIYDIVGLVMGFISLFIVVGLALITTLDICYLTIPIFQDKVRHENWDGSSGKGKMRFISNDAKTSVEKFATNPNGKTALTMYLFKRIKTYCICAVILFIILSGSNMLIPIVARVVTDLINTLSR